jgi:hypothetical protein
MTVRCAAPIEDALLVDYWIRSLPESASEAIEDHVFTCTACAARLEALVSMASTVASLVRQGRFAGMISRATLNQLQHDGLRARIYSLSPGDTVPCAVFPEDDLVVTALRGDFTGIDAVTVVVAAPVEGPLSKVVLDDVPVMAAQGELLWAAPASVIRQMPTSRVTLTVSVGSASGRRIGEYVLDHGADRQVG